MPGFLTTKSKPKPASDSGDEASIRSDSSKPKSIKAFPGKVAKGVKRQMQRLDEVYHHVTHTEHRHRRVSSPNLSSSITPVFSVVRPFIPSPRSTRTRETWHSKYASETNSGSSTSLTSTSTHQLPIIIPPTDNQVDMSEGPSVDEPSNSEPMFSSPPAVYIETEASDPFLIDEEGDALEAEEEVPSPGAVTPQTTSPAHNIPLDLPSSPSPEEQKIPVSPLPDINKDIPPPPVVTESDEEEELPEVYLPALIAPSIFLPIPNTDPLTTLLNKYIYPPEKRPHRDVSGEWQRNDVDFHTLVMTNSWRALAKMARDRLLKADPGDLTLVLSLWHLRLSCLARLRLFNQTSAECTNLFAVLNTIDPKEAREYIFERVLPFELEVMQTRLKYWAGDHMGYLDALSALLRKCRMKCRQSGNDPTLVPMWKERGARVCLIIASQMVEMKEITAAASLLEPLCAQDGGSNSALRSSVARVYLQGGNIEMAAKHFALVAQDPETDEKTKQMNAALLASAEGNWEEAADVLRAVLEKDDTNFVAVNNLSVALLSQGKLKEGIQVLETALQLSPSSVVVAEPFLFNLSTLYELRSNLGFERKKDLLVEVAKWSGDGLRTTCLKMPVN